MIRWASARHISVGAIASPQTVFELGRDWYATRFSFDFERPTAAQAHGIFERHGLSGEFWTLG